MAATGFKCMKCGKIFRRIHGTSTEELSKILSTEESEKFRGEDFSCCGEEHLKTLHELGMLEEMMKLQMEWIDITRKS